MHRFANLERRFPDRIWVIDRLMREDPGFEELCADFEAAAVALDYWQSPPRQAERQASDYRQLVAELAEDIEDLLEKRCAGCGAPVRPDPHEQGRAFSPFPKGRRKK